MKNEQLDRIEELLRLIVALLTAEEESEEVELDLEGNPLPTERNQNQSL